jgi:hypothetical protein
MPNTWLKGKQIVAVTAIEINAMRYSLKSDRDEYFQILVPDI